jgi:acetyl esterase/lipase
MHGNVAYFLASQNCVSILSTYRLLPTARYPQGAEDIAASLSWVVANIDKYGGSPSQIFPIGQSAGGAHLATALFTGLLKELIPNLGGMKFQSAPLWYDLRQDRRRVNMQHYHETEDAAVILSKTSVANFEKCPKEEAENWPVLLFTVGEYDSEEIVDGNLMFMAEYRKKMKKMPLFEVLEGHNHISYCLGMGLPEDMVGPRIVRFINERSGN